MIPGAGCMPLMFIVIPTSHFSSYCTVSPCCAFCFWLICVACGTSAEPHSHCFVSCSGSVLVLACAPSQEPPFNYIVSAAVCCSTELLSLPELFGLQRPAISRPYRGKLWNGWCLLLLVMHHCESLLWTRRCFCGP